MQTNHVKLFMEANKSWSYASNWTSRRVIKISNKHLPITITKKGETPIERRDGYCVVCLHPECRKTEQSQWKRTKPFYKFQEIHRRKVHGFGGYKLQVDTCSSLLKYSHDKECKLENDNNPKDLPSGKCYYQKPKPITLCRVHSDNKRSKLFDNVDTTIRSMFKS